MIGKPSRVSGRDPAMAAAKSLWKELFGGHQDDAPRPQREIWNPETREYYRTVMGPRTVATPWYPLATFSRRLEVEIERAKRESRPIAVIVFHLPETATATEQGRTAVEIRLRLELRPDDLSTRLSEQVLAVALPGTGASAVEVAARLERALCSWAGGPVSAGVAHYPQDGDNPSELLRRAIGRSTAAATGQPETALGE